MIHSGRGKHEARHSKGHFERYDPVESAALESEFDRLEIWLHHRLSILVFDTNGKLEGADCVFQLGIEVRGREGLPELLG